MPEKVSAQKAYWDKVAPEKNFTLQPDMALLKKQLPFHAFVLDYGCGYGRTLEQLYRAGYTRTLGLDFSPAMVQRGRMQFPHLHLKKTDGVHTNLPAASVDMVMLIALLTCVVDDLEQQKLMAEFKRILKPGGLVYVMDFLLNEDERNRKRYAAFAKKYGKYGVFDLPEGATLRHHSEGYVKNLMNGFRIVRFEKTKNKTMNGHVSNGFLLMAEKL